MSPTQTTVIISLINIFLITLIASSFAVIIKKHAKINLYLYLPFGFLSFLGITYLLSFPIILLRLSAEIYQSGLIIIIICAFAYASYIVLTEKLYKNLDYEKIAWGIFSLIFIALVIFQASRNTLAERAFDSVFYTTFVSNNVHPTIMGFTNYDSNLVTTTLDTQYAFSSYYYFNALIINIVERIIPNFNQMLYSPIYIWQATFIHAALTITSIINIYKALTKSRQWIFFILLFSVAGVFYGSQYYNNALAFIGNSNRLITVANVFLIAYLLFQEKKNDFFSYTLFMLTISSLISFSSSSFFISAFFLYGYFYSLLSVKGKKSFAIIAYISIPMLLFLFAYLFEVYSLVLTPLCVLVLYAFSRFNDKISTKIIFLFHHLIAWIIPLVIISLVIIFPTVFVTKYDYFFIQASHQDMVWSYFDFTSLLPIAINLLFFSFIVILMILERKERIFAKTMSVSLCTFLNPLVMPFTILFFTNVVFYRGFDLFFNPFIIAYAVKLLYDKLNNQKMKNIVMIAILFPFLLFGIQNFPKHYHYYFKPSKNYNRVLKMNNGEFDALSVLYEIILQEKLEYPIIASQIYLTLGSMPNIQMPYSAQTMRSNSFKNINTDQALLLNVFALYETPGPEWVIDNYQELGLLLDKNNVTFAIVAHGSNYYDPIEDRYYYLEEAMSQYFTLIYENDYYSVYRRPIEN
jgi:hypothetical protein